MAALSNGRPELAPAHCDREDPEDAEDLFRERAYMRQGHHELLRNARRRDSDCDCDSDSDGDGDAGDAAHAALRMGGGGVG